MGSIYARQKQQHRMALGPDRMSVSARQFTKYAVEKGHARGRDVLMAVIPFWLIQRACVHLNAYKYVWLDAFSPVPS